MKKLWFLLIFLFLPAVLFGQGYDKTRTRAAKEEPVVRLQIESWSFGFGSFFDQESVTFSQKALYGVFQFHGLGFPALEEGVSTGVSVEGHPGSLLTVSEGDIRVQNLNNVDFRVWSITRVPVSTIPFGIFQSGMLSRTFSGLDVLLHEQGADWTGNHDVRMVLGGDLGVFGPGNFVVELYLLQENVPIAFAVIYGI